MNSPLAMMALGLGVALALAGCDHDDRRTDAGEARSQAEAGKAAVAADTARDPASTERMPSAVGGANATLAMSGTASSHVVDGAGSAVYVLAGNLDGSKCDAACEEVWPPVIANEEQPTAGTGIEAARIGTLQRGDRTHVTYGGAPLYRYSGDLGANRTTGAGVEDQWGKWSLVGLDGQALPDPD